MEKSPQPKNNKQRLSDYGRYSTMAFQMIVPIVLGVWGGMQLDKYFQLKFPAFTLSLSLLSVAGGVYWAVKDLLKKKD